VDGTDSELCPMSGFGNIDDIPSGSATTVFVILPSTVQP
jgi:hypothetical protein